MNSAVLGFQQRFVQSVGFAYLPFNAISVYCTLEMTFRHGYQYAHTLYAISGVNGSQRICGKRMVILVEKLVQSFLAAQAFAFSERML